MKTIVLEQPQVCADGYAPSRMPQGQAMRWSRSGALGFAAPITTPFGAANHSSTIRASWAIELGVEVLDVGPDCGAVSAGDICALEPYINCGTCIACRAGKTNCCTSLKVLGVHTDGGMRERIVVPASKLHASPGFPLISLHWWRRWASELMP